MIKKNQNWEKEKIRSKIIAGCKKEPIRSKPAVYDIGQLVLS